MTSIPNALRHSALAAMVTALLVACATPSLSSAQEASPGTQPISDDARLRIDEVLAAYDRIHARLASDQVAAVRDDAKTLEDAASAAALEAPQRLRDELRNVAESAAHLAKAPKDDAKKVRVAFGEVSRSVVALLSLEPTLRKDRHVFSCPMAQEYKKWVQASAEVSNPYMGQRMQTCGSNAEWTE